MRPRRFLRLVPLLLVLLVSLPTGCAGRKKKDASLLPRTTEEAYSRAMGFLVQRQLRQALAALKRIDFGPESRERLEPLTRLAIADATFYQDSDLTLIDARNLYLDFVTLYGDHPLAPYAQLQVGSCSLKQVSHPSRDQSQTLQAISDLEAVAKRWPGTRWAHAASGLLREARANLAESEFLVGRFYLKRKSFVAAAERFRGVLDHYPEYSGMEKVLFHLGEAYVLSGNRIEGQFYLDKIVHDYPEGPYAAQARKTLAMSVEEIEPKAVAR